MSCEGLDCGLGNASGTGVLGGALRVFGGSGRGGGGPAILESMLMPGGPVFPRPLFGN